MNGFELVNELNDLTVKLTDSIRLYAKYGRDMAAKERDYKIILRQEALKLRAEGEAVTMIDKIVYGVPEVAEKRFERDVAEAMYKAAEQNINSIKWQLRITDNQINREWGNT